jgi:hypothetical protein
LEPPVTDDVAKPVRAIDGARIEDLDGFYDEISREVIPGATWGRNLHAFNDILRGGFGTPDGGFIFLWKNAARSRRALGYAGTVRWLRGLPKVVHPTNVEERRRQIALALAGEGETLFDLLVGIVRSHGPGGAEAEDGVDLVLEE